MPKLLQNYRFYVSIVAMVMGIGTQMTTSRLIQANFPDRQPIYDTLFATLPYWPGLSGVGDIANVISVVLLAVYVFRGNSHRLPFVFSLIGFAYFTRGVLIYLNPFGGPLGNDVHYGLTQWQQFGQFPSGHQMLVVLIYLVIDGTRYPWLKRLALISCIVEAFGLLVSHGHYSIDIVGGVLVGYFAYHVLKPYDSRISGSHNKK